MNKQDVFEIGLGLIIGFHVFSCLHLWELNITDWHLDRTRGMVVTLSLGVYAHRNSVGVYRGG